MKILPFLFFALAPLAHAGDSVTLALDWKPEPEFGGFYAAEKAGVYAQHGLSVKLVPGGAGQPVVQMVAAGKADFGTVSADEVLLARSHGADVVAVYAVYQTAPYGIMVHESAGLQSLADVFKAPLTLAIEKGLPYAEFLKTTYGFGPLKIVPYSGGVGGFLHDPKFAQQCFVTSEPLEAKHQGADPKTFLVADSGFNPYTTVVVTQGKLLREKPEVVKELVQSIREGWRQYLDNPEPANQLMHKLNSGMALSTFAESAAAQKALIETNETKTNGLGSMTLKRWETLDSQLVQLKLLASAPDASKVFADVK